MSGRTKTTHPADHEPRALPAWALLLTCFMMLSYVSSALPTPIVWSAIPCIIGLLVLVEGSPTLRQCIGWLMLFGTLVIGAGYYWLAPTVQAFGNVPAVWSWLLVALFGLSGGVQMWAFAFFHRRLLKRSRRPHPLLTCALLVGVEELPIRLFPWKMGYGAVDVPALTQAAEWGGVSAVSFVMCCLIVPLHEWLRWRFARSGAPARPRAALVTFLLGVVLVGVGAWRFSDVVDQESQAPQRLKVAIVQPNIGSSHKRQAERNEGQAYRESLAAYRRGSERAVEQGAQLVVWPETAITQATPIGRGEEHVPRRTNQVLAANGYGFLSKLGSGCAFLLGIYEQKSPLRQENGRPVDERFNTASLRMPGGLEAPWQVYRKVYLIPFGEYMPVGPSTMLPQNFLMLPGEMPQALLELNGTTIAPFLCYEGILDGHIRSLAGGRRPDLLVSLTNDSWFGDTWEPYQHLQFTRFRAIEHRAPLVRATNTGISAFVSATGQVVKRLGVFEEGVLEHDVPLVPRGRTIYARFGYLFAWAMFALALGAMALGGRRVQADPAG